MTLAAGTRLGAYEITAPIGAGGMGEVYRAKDTRLKRDVAIKVLPDGLATDPERLARFQREAELLASLNHPNIAGIHGLEEAGGTCAIVLELVEGDTLAEMIARGPIAIAEALPIARQIVDALEAAHEKGIIHRDLKPANIKITPDGKVKVLDFGLAAVAADSPVSDLNATHSPTLTFAATRAGVILGTASYMAPEQASGKTADARADIWSFGVVLWEMLTGRRLFEGETISHTLAFVLTKAPDWSALPTDTPSAIRRLLRRTLERDRKRRLPDIASARLEIDDALHQRDLDSQAAVAAVPAPARWAALRWAIATLTIVVAALVIGWALRRETSSPPVMYVDVATPSATTVPAISPDGHKIVFGAVSDSGVQLWLRALDEPAGRPLPRTERGQFPFWSPDGRSVAFYADGFLKRLDVENGAVQTITSAPPFGGAWHRDGFILMGSLTGEIVRVSDQGGKPVALAGQWSRTQKRVIEFLPDGRHFLYFELSGPRNEERGVVLADLNGSRPRRLIEGAETASYFPTGHLLYVRNGTLSAQAFDPDAQSVSGTPIVIAEAVIGNTLTVSPSGSILYRTGGDPRTRALAWVDRSGDERVVDAIPGLEMWTLAPDGRRVAMQRLQNENVDIWLYDLERRTYDRFTYDDGMEVYPVWSPDSTRVAFSLGRRDGGLGLYEKRVGTAGNAVPLLTGGSPKRADDWSRDGRYLLYTEINEKDGDDLWALPLEGERKPFPVVRTPFQDTGGQFSPDGEWIAYRSDESGQTEVYLLKFPTADIKLPVSTSGGRRVRWRSDGKELFYIDLDNKLMSVSVDGTKGRAVQLGRPVPLFRTLIVGGQADDRLFAVANADRFLMVIPRAEIVNAPIRMILNWRPRAN